MDSEQSPADPFTTPLSAEIMQVYEVFMTYVTVGFTRAEALQITIALLTNGNGGPPR